MKRGVGSLKQSKVLVIAESKAVDEILCEYLPLRDATVAMGKVGMLSEKSKGKSVIKAILYIKMFVIEDLKAETIDNLLDKFLDKNTIIVTDGSTSHVNLRDNFANHIAIVEKNPKEVVKKSLPWVHIVIGECRNGISAIHKDIDKRFLQLYLNEYCWKFNRRFFRDSADPKYDLFDRLVKISATFTSDIKWRDYSGENDNEIDD